MQMAQSPSTPGPYEADNPMEDRSEHADESHLDAAAADQDADMHDDKTPGARNFVEATEPTDYSLFSNAPGLGVVRQRLFDIEDTIEMSQSDFHQYFPFVDNVWRRSKSGETTDGKDEVVDIYWCRRKKASGMKPYIPKPTPEGKTSRKKRARDETTCPMAIKVIKKDGQVKSCIIQRAAGPEVRHTHDLDYMDSVKRNSGIMDVARREAVKGFLPGSVFWKMQEEPDKMLDAGGKFMKISDVRNVQYSWRQDNPSMVLKAHHGYSQANKVPKPKDPSHTPGPPPPPNVFQQQSLPQPAPPPPQLLHTPAAPPPPQPHFGQPPAVHPALAEDSARTALQYPDHAREFLEPYLPNNLDQAMRPHVTLTWATSLDARISLMPNMRTAISGPETKAMTHYLRSRHDAIIIGVKTALADDPSLNCRLVGAGGYGGPQAHQQPRPVIIDPKARLPILRDMKVLKVAAEGRAKAPWIVVTPSAKLHPVAIQTLRSLGGEYLMIHDIDPRTGKLNWEAVFNVLLKEGLKSIMIEGGGQVLSELLRPRYSEWIDSVILTVAPTFFGRGGVDVSPEPSFDVQSRQPVATRLKHVRWQPMGDVDVVMCGQLRGEATAPNGMLPGIQEFIQPPADAPRSAYPPLQNGMPDKK